MGRMNVVREAEQKANALPAGGHLRLGSLLRALFAQAERDKLRVHAGNLAFRGLFALFPALFAALWLLQAFGAAGTADTILAVAETAMPDQATGPLREQVGHALQSGGGADSLTAAAALGVALWTLAGAGLASMDALNAMYGVEERRSSVRRWRLALLLGAGVAILLLAAVIAIIFGQAAAERLAERLAWGPLFTWGFAMVKWPVLTGTVLLAFSLLYYFAPDVEQEVRWLRWGTLAAVAGWLLFTVAFSFYVNNIGSYSRLYGAIAGFAVLMVYLYATAFILLIGAEVNQILEIADPEGKDEGAREPTHRPAL